MVTILPNRILQCTADDLRAVCGWMDGNMVPLAGDATCIVYPKSRQARYVPLAGSLVCLPSALPSGASEGMSVEEFAELSALAEPA